MKKLILSFCLMAFATFSFGQNSPLAITDGTNALNLSVATLLPGTGNNDLVIQTAGASNRTQLYVSPTGTNTSAFLNLTNNSDINNAGYARLGLRGSYGIFSVTNIGTPSIPLTNFAIELDPTNSTTGEAMVVTSNAFNGGSGSPTILAKIDAAGLSTIEAKVQANVAAPDYVFSKDYNLRSLNEVEEYISQNSHLPEIPSAAEFAKNGITLGKMSFDLLKKVEELTLYMIDLKKENEALKIRLNNLENK